MPVAIYYTVGPIWILKKKSDFDTDPFELLEKKQKFYNKLQK